MKTPSVAHISRCCHFRGMTGQSGGTAPQLQHHRNALRGHQGYSLPGGMAHCETLAKPLRCVVPTWGISCCSKLPCPQKRVTDEGSVTHSQSTLESGLSVITLPRPIPRVGLSPPGY